MANRDPIPNKFRKLYEASSGPRKVYAMNLPQDMVDMIDELRGAFPRSRWIEAAMREALEKELRQELSTYDHKDGQ